MTHERRSSRAVNICTRLAQIASLSPKRPMMFLQPTSKLPFNFPDKTLTFEAASGGSSFWFIIHVWPLLASADPKLRCGTATSAQR